MKMKKSSIALAAGCLLILSTITQAAESGNISIGLKGGTLGGGIEAGIDLGDALVLRGGINYLTYSFDSTISNVDYNFEPECMTGSLLLDWHPFTNSFRLTAGAYLNNNEVKVDGIFRKDLIPDEYSNLPDLAHVKGTVDFNTFAPYVGLGWSSSNPGEAGWGISLDLGVMFQGTPDVSELYIDDPWGLGKEPAVTDFLADEQQSVQDELDKFQYYPVASISLNYKF
jgi:hypothetical protein